jgi:tetratricopeptide (TPR) repeat protein
MPRNPASDIEHVVFTDHAIRRRARPPGGSLPADADLVPFGAGAASRRDLGLAYAMVGLREQNPAYIERAFHLLQQTVARGPADALTLAYLAEFYRDRKDDAHALPLYEKAWEMDTTQSAVAAALGAYQMQHGQLRTGHPLLEPGSGHRSSAGSGAPQSCHRAAAHRARRASSGDVATGLEIPTVVSGGQRSAEPDREIS